MGKITVVGLGYEENQLTLQAIQLLRSGARVILHTQQCGCAQWLRDQKIAFESLDGLYESCEDFDEHAQLAADAVLKAAADADVVYGVFDVRDRSVGALLDAAGREIRVVAGPPAEDALLAYAKGPVDLLEASDWENYALSSRRNALVRELDGRQLAGEVKLRLMEVYPEESQIFVRFGDGGIARTELYNLDRLQHYDHRTCALIPAVPDLTALERYDFDRLLQVISILCGPDGCPWDREQTHQSLRPYIVEEAYEVVDAIDADDPDQLYDELGDMLLQVVLHAEIARRHGEFDIGDVVSAIGAKMIHRHSHIFGKDRAANPEEVSDLWSRNKMAERGQTSYAESMHGVAKSLPGLLRAGKVLKRLDQACRCSQTLDAALEDAARAIQDVPEATDREKALGEALLAMAAVTRSAGVDPEIALNAAVDRLIDRFETVEAQASLDKLPAQKLREYWDLVKLSDAAENRQE